MTLGVQDTLHSRTLSAHIGYLFTELPFERRIEAARAAGFQAIEHPQPFEIDAQRMRSALEASALTFSQLAAGVGDAAKGEKGLAAIPGREADFLDALARSIDYAAAIKCPFVHPMAGIPEPGTSRETVRATYVANLRRAVENADAAGLAILVETISAAAVPGYFACDMNLVLDAADEAAPGAIFVLLDTFHARAYGLDIPDFIRRKAPRIGHVHIADYPGRHEPGTGAFNFSSFLKNLEEVGYRGALGFEYVPVGETDRGLTWLREPMWRRS